MPRRTLQRRAHDALCKLGIRDVSSLTADEIAPIAQSLRRCRVADDVSQVRSCVANGVLPSRLADGKASIVDSNQQTLVSLDYYSLSDGITVAYGIAEDIGTADSFLIGGLKVKCVTPRQKKVSPCFVVSTKSIMPGAPILCSFRIARRDDVAEKQRAA